MPNDSQLKSKDKWDKIDIILKGVVAIIITAAITTYGIVSQKERAKEAERNRLAQEVIQDKNRRLQAVIQALGNRETTLADMRAKMFGTLIQYYFKGDDVSKIVILELLAMNFQDIFQLKPLFKNLNVNLNTDSEKRTLKHVAENIINQEINKIIATGGNIYDLVLEKNKIKQVDSLPLFLKLILISRKDNIIRIIVNPTETNVPFSLPADDNIADIRGNINRLELNNDLKKSDAEGFEVSYFDMPLTENREIKELTYSLVLSSILENEEKAKIKVIIFPKYYYSGDNRLRLDKMIGDFLIRDVPGPINK